MNTDLDSALVAPVFPEYVMPVAPQPEPRAWTEGLVADERHVSVGDNSGVLTIIAAMFVLVLLSYRQCRRLFTTLIPDLWDLRSRRNAFDEHTSNESRVLAMLMVQTAVYGGLLLYSHLAATVHLPAQAALGDCALMIGLFAGYLVVQLAVYWLVGYTFVDAEGTRHLVRGFISSQVLLGFLLIIPALVAIFYPKVTNLAVAIGIICYISLRFVFICKVFRIFYYKIESLLYFILYLCTLEIIPVILVYKLSLILVKI